MNIRFIVPAAASIFIFTSGAFGQGRAASEFQITRITKNLISTPEYTYNGAQQYPVNQRAQWLEVEVEFSAAPEYTDELMFKYYIAINGKILTGEITHMNVAAGRENRSVMYVAPRTLERLMGNKPLTPNSIQNIAVQITHQGTAKSELSLERAAAGWFTATPGVAGFVLNKNETPFAPLYWDRYEQIKAASR